MDNPTLEELKDRAQGFYNAAERGWFTPEFCLENIERIQRQMEEAEKQERQGALFES